MLPDVSDALAGWTRTLLVKTVTQTTVDFEPVVSVSGADYEAVVQPTKMTTLNKDTLDWTQKHITLHGYTGLEFGQLVEYKGKDYKVVDTQDFSDYGYFESVCQATNKPTVEVTE